ncbi:MAG: hypothetical protein RIF32_17645 [Leptospirales bacterium]|jgi:hypothetical protein
MNSFEPTPPIVFPGKTPRRSLTRAGLLPLFSFATAFVAAFSLHGPLLRAQNADLIQIHSFSESRIDNSQETRLFPAKVAVPGLLWGTTPGYQDGMVQLKISCGVDDSRLSENADGEEEEKYVALFRVELYRYHDGDWQYVDWYRLPGTPPASACKSLKTAAGLAKASRPLHVRLKIGSRGTQHRNLVEDWNFDAAAP